jgi:hypothetical protein
VDVLIIGAGLTGASAAYHLGPAARDRSLRVAVMIAAIRHRSATQRRQLELLPENFHRSVRGLARERLRFLLHVYPSVPIEVLHAESERQASLVLGMALRNRDRLQQSSMTNRSIAIFLHADGFTSPTPTAKNRECARRSCSPPSTASASNSGRGRKILEEFDIRTDFVGRFIPAMGRIIRSNMSLSVA